MSCHAIILEREASHGRQRAIRALIAEQQEPIKDLACKASTVAIEPGDAAQDYYMYLLKVQVMGVKFSNMPLQIHGRTPFLVNFFLGWHLN